MNRAFVKNFLLLYHAGWRPYNANNPPKAVYEKLGCPHAGAGGKEPFWFVRGETFLCVTCNRSCALTRPEGFILPLPLAFPPPAKREKEFALTPGEMIVRKKLLRVDETAYCLNISERAVYDWIAEGKLRRAVGGGPVRVLADDVAYYMQNFEE
ncbi:MAG: helix-turn-helix domain-containing protein [Deltaproteobacteria bacterium]|jgi:excisionase family DNA binding protein|nr:helix-turn-helix domain-containing protein [Deltaproteobacteria bacterium]